MVRLPESDDRTLIIGATGSGKTNAGVWLLHTRDWHKRPWVILDFKGEKLFRELDLTPLNLTDKLPTEAGIYWVRILPSQENEVSEFFMRCYEHENIGIYIDEGYMLPYQDRWVRACLTQGRSKNIELICLTQRPVRIDVFFLSEASFIGIFSLRVKDDRKRVSEYMNGAEIRVLPQYHWSWYDVVNDKLTTFQPVPPPSKLVEQFKVDLEEFEEVQNLPENNNRVIKL